jgi:four helix bundle protein
MEEQKYDLEDRLLGYSLGIIKLVEKAPNTRVGNHAAGQLLRSGTSPYVNHGEAQAAESSQDFIHKMRICLKELRESKRWLKLIQQVPLVKQLDMVEVLLEETEELIRIFAVSIRTAKKNRKNR